MSLRSRYLPALALAGLLSLLGACANHQGHDMSMDGMNMGLMASGAWSRATPPGTEIGAAYLQISNHGTAGDRLLGASTAVASSVEMHESKMDQGMMKMRQVEAVALAAGDSVSFEPGGLHLMLMGLQQPLTEGQHFEIQLRFEQAGVIDVPVMVQAMGADGSNMDHSSHMGHQ